MDGSRKADFMEKYLRNILHVFACVHDRSRWVSAENLGQITNPEQVVCIGITELEAVNLSKVVWMPR